MQHAEINNPRTQKVCFCKDAKDKRENNADRSISAKSLFLFSLQLLSKFSCHYYNVAK